MDLLTNVICKPKAATAIQKQLWILTLCWKWYFFTALCKIAFYSAVLAVLCQIHVTVLLSNSLPLILTEHWNLECYIKFDSLPLSFVHSQQSCLCQQNFMRSIACHPEGDWWLCSLCHGPAFLKKILSIAISAFSWFLCADISSKL